MLGNSAFNQNATDTANRYLLFVGGVNFSTRADVKLGSVTVSLQGPGGISSMQFTIERAYPGTVAPFWGRQYVYFYDSQSDVKFRGFIVHTSWRRSKGTKQVITVDCAGYDKQLDERIVVSFKTRADTTQGAVSRARKFANDDALVKAILQWTKLDGFIGDGAKIDRTQTDMDDMNFKGVSAREALQQIADVAQIASSSSTRRFYIGGHDGLLHYYSGTEGDPAPFRINEDGRYVQTMIQATGLVSFWCGRLNSAGDVVDENGTSSAVVNGGVTTNGIDSLCINAPEKPGMRFNGTTGYLLPSAASLHVGNTGTWGCVFKRRTTGSQQAIMSGGTDDILIGFDATDHIRVQKEGTGDGFVSNATYTDTTSSYHLAVTHSAGNGFIVYVNGAAIAGTATSRTLSAGSNPFSIGRKKTTSDQYYAGNLWGVWVSTSELSAAAILGQFNLWCSIEPEDLVIDRDSTDTTRQVYVQGGQDDKTKGNGTGTGFEQWGGSTDSAFEDVVPPGAGAPLLAQEFIDRADSDNTRKRGKYANAYMAAKAGTVVSATFSLTYDPKIVQRPSIPSAWRPGQLVVITSNDAQGFNAYQLEVKQVDVDILGANGVTKFDISAGALPYSGLRHIRSRGMA